MEPLMYKGNPEAKKISEVFFKGLLVCSDFDYIEDQVNGLREIGFDHSTERHNVVGKFLVYYHESKDNLKSVHLVKVLDLSSNQVGAIICDCLDLYRDTTYTLDMRKVFHMPSGNMDNCRYFQGTKVFDAKSDALNYYNELAK